MPIPMSMWMFQTKLRVDAGGAEVFLPVRDVLEQDWPEHDEEVRRLNLQYRNRLEFAIGRTCSVDWVVRDGARRATEVSTTWLPVGETPQTRARSVTDALLSMDAPVDGHARRAAGWARAAGDRLRRLARRAGGRGGGPAAAPAGDRRAGAVGGPAGARSGWPTAWSMSPPTRRRCGASSS